MLKAIKVTMIIYGILGFLAGLAYIVVPRQFPSFMASAGMVPPYVGNTAAKLGFSYVAAAVFMVAATRNLIKNILWVKFTIAFAFLQLAAAILSAVLGYITFNQALIDIVLHSIFGLMLTGMYFKINTQVAEK